MRLHFVDDQWIIFPQQYLCLVHADFLFVCQYQHIANLGAKILVVGKQGIDKNEGFHGCEIDADKQEPNTAETYIHTGTGLPERSALAVKGKKEVEESKDDVVTFYGRACGSRRLIFQADTQPGMFVGKIA